jgi:hypothetical protein
MMTPGDQQQRLKYFPYVKPAILAASIDGEGVGLLSTKTIKPGHTSILRFLPPMSDEHRELDFMRLVEHEWPGRGDIEYCGLRARCLCPRHTHPSLLASPSDQCAACDQGVELRNSALAYAVEDGKRSGGILIKFTRQNLNVLEQLLVEDDVFNPQSGCWVELWADESWKLHYRCLEDCPIDEEDFRLVCGTGELAPLPRKGSADTLANIAAARRGWIKAGQPLPGDRRNGSVLELADTLLKGCTLISMPWFMKGPHGPESLGWQNTSYRLMVDHDYRLSLCHGNAGLLCGRDWQAVQEGLIPNRVIIGLDGDDDDFADSVWKINRWLDNTFAVEGGRGVKWFFALVGVGIDKYLQSSKIMRRGTGSKGEDEEVGDWLSATKQGLVFGGHPSGKFYRHNGKPIVEVTLKDFRRPRNSYLPAYEVHIPTAKEMYRQSKYGNRAKTVGPILNVARLLNKVQTGKGIECQCPACHEEGRDKNCDNLLIFPDGRYQCAALIGCGPQENHRHNQRIYGLVGLEREGYED